MSSPPIALPRRRTARAAKWSGGSIGAFLATLGLVAVIGAPPGPSGCGADGAGDEGSATAAVTAVGHYPKPLKFGPYVMLPSQLVFADVLAKRVGWDVWVIRAQVLNEQNGAAAEGYARRGYFNWLNLSHDDNLNGRGRLEGRAVWKDPVSAANASADWIQWKTATLGEHAAPSIRDAYRRGRGAPPMEAIRYLQTSRWASSGYPDLPGIYRAIANRGAGEPTDNLATNTAEPAAAQCTGATAGTGTGKWRIAPGAFLPSVPIDPQLRAYLDRVATFTSKPFVLTTGSAGHSLMTTNGSRSEHSIGRAGDFGSSENGFANVSVGPSAPLGFGDDLAMSALVAAGVPAGKARANERRGGITNVLCDFDGRRVRVQVIFRSESRALGGIHTNHVHIGVGDRGKATRRPYDLTHIGP